MCHPAIRAAIYFSDDVAVAVGFVRGGQGIEEAAIDPVAGAVFYRLEDLPSGSLCEVGRNHSVLASLAFTLAPCCSGAFIKSR
jgi:hypothetical protein